MVNSFEPEIAQYAAKTFFNLHEEELLIPNVKGFALMALDIGYSSTKVYSIYGKHIFPSLPIRVEEDHSVSTKETDIKYKDEDGNLWYIGDVARSQLYGGGVRAQEETLLGPQRINSPDYLVLLRVGIFLGLAKKDEKDGFKIEREKQVKIRTGLPLKYVDLYNNEIMKAFVGRHRFEVKIGDKPWTEVDITISQNDVAVLPQPMGSLWALATNRLGEETNPGLLSENTLVFDGGHYTADTFLTIEGEQSDSRTWENISMVKIIEKLIKTVEQRTGGNASFRKIEFSSIIHSPRLPGKVTYKDGNQVYDIKGDLVRHTEEVAKAAIKEIDTAYFNLRDIHNLVCTGGTGKLFYPFFKRNYESENRVVLLAERNDSENSADDFTTVFANAVGFFNVLAYELAQFGSDGYVGSQTS